MRPCLSSLYESIHTWKYVFEGSRALNRDGVQGERIFLADTYLSDRSFFDVVDYFKNIWLLNV